SPSAPGRDGIFLGNVLNNGHSDTLAHEPFHFVGDSDPVHQPDGRGHSSDPRNIIAAGPIQWDPGMATKELSNGPPWYIPDTLDVIGPVLNVNGVWVSPANGDPDGPPRVGGVDRITTTPDAPGGQGQVERIFETAPGNGAAPYIQASRNPAAGDRVDFDF